MSAPAQRKSRVLQDRDKKHAQGTMLILSMINSAISKPRCFKGVVLRSFRTYTGSHEKIFMARLAQSAERKALNLVVVGSSPTVGVSCTGVPFGRVSEALPHV